MPIALTPAMTPCGLLMHALRRVEHRTGHPPACISMHPNAWRTVVSSSPAGTINWDTRSRSEPASTVAFFNDVPVTLHAGMRYPSLLTCRGDIEFV